MAGIFPATPATVRQVNRSIILNLLRRSQPLSRQQLCEVSGIYRSSISELVDELVRERLVIEKASTPRGRGRVPIELRLNPRGFRVLGVSIRPFRTYVAVAGLAGTPQRSLSFPTPRQPRTLLRHIAKAAAKLRGREVLHHAAVAVPGPVSVATGVISSAPTLPAYRGFPLAGELALALGAPVLADNDCNLGALGEMWMNASEVAGLDDFVFLQVGDLGVGAGLVFDGALYHGRDGTGAGEFGHMMIRPDGLACPCGRTGCWERYVCDAATWARYAPRENFSPNLFEKLLRAAGRNSTRALKAVRETAEYLSLGIANVCFALNPQTIIIAGEITRSWPAIESIVCSRWTTDRLGLRIRPASLPIDRLTINGAIALALTPRYGVSKSGVNDRVL